MAKARFQVWHVYNGESVATIEMDEELIRPEAKIVDPSTMTLRHLKNGGQYTLIPVEDHTVATLLRVKQVYENVTQKPAPLFTTAVARMDDLIQAVGLLFGEVEYLVVEKADDLDKIINPPRNSEYNPKTVKYTILGDLLKNATAAAGLTEVAEHQHGPGCSHAP